MYTKILDEGKTVIIKGTPEEMAAMWRAVVNKDEPQVTPEPATPIRAITILELERKKRGWNKEEFGERAFCSGSFYGTVERRKKAAGRAYALSIATALGMSIKELFDDEGMALYA